MVCCVRVVNICMRASARWGAGCVCQGRGVLRAASKTQQDYCGCEA